MDISKATFWMQIPPGHRRIMEMACIIKDFSCIATEVNCSVQLRPVLRLLSWPRL